jgi:hypothetical protein
VMREQRDSAQADFKLLAEAFADAYQPRTALDATPAPQEPAAPNEADAHLAALLRYTEGFYATAIEHGMRAGPTADSVAHIEKAARRLHALAAPPLKAPQEPAEPVATEQSTVPVYTQARPVRFIRDEQDCKTFMNEQALTLEELADCGLLSELEPPLYTLSVADTQDARRYRIARKWGVRMPSFGPIEIEYGEHADAAIDAALDVTKRDLRPPEDQ